MLVFYNNEIEYDLFFIYIMLNFILSSLNNDDRKEIEIEIVDHEEYERNESFFVELSEPIFESNPKTSKY